MKKGLKNSPEYFQLVSLSLGFGDSKFEFQRNLPCKPDNLIAYYLVLFS